MGSIPFSSENIKYVDPETKVEYSLKQATDETELAILEFDKTFESDRKKRGEIFKSNEREWRRFVNGNIDIILCGWTSDDVELPKFPKSNPSKMMRYSLKVSILEWWNTRKDFSIDDIKN